MRCHRSIPTHCGTCLRFALAGAAHSRQPLPRQSVIGTFPHPRSAAAAVRCAGETTVPCSFLRSAALTLRSLLQIPTSCLSAQGITARLAAFLHTPTLCADRRTERQARLAAFLHTPTLCADRRTERQARLAAGGVCLTLLQHSNILNRLLLPFFHFSPPAPC